MSKKSKVKPMKDLEIISDPKTIKVLFEPTRADIVFKFLINGSMTVKQLADALGKNPGTILHHIDKLKEVGLVVQERTEQTVTGIVQRYYRATAREFRLGIGGMMETDGGVAQFTKDRLTTMITSLSVYGIEVSEEEVDGAMKLLRPLIERENTVSSNLPILEEPAYHNLPPAIRDDASRIMRRFILDEDSQYRELRERWNIFLRSHRKGK
ncbi:MAG: ArsR family transcriptional regulator [Candidatus Thorarchaeota archaeon]